MRYGWCAGRALWLSIASVVVTLGLLYAWWWVPFDGPWAPPDDPRYVQMFELLPILGAIVALYGVQPRLDWIDLQSPRPIATLDTVAAGVVIAVFAVLPSLAIWLWHVWDLYEVFLPEGVGLTEAGGLPSYGLFVAFACNTLVVLGLACLTIAVSGRALGPLSAVVWFALLLVLQGHLGWDMLPSITVHGGLPTPSLMGAVIAGAVLAVGLSAYHRGAAGTRALIR